MQQQLNQMLEGIDRQALIKAVAIGLVVYAILYGCAGIMTGIGSVLAGGATGLTSIAASQTTGVDSIDAEMREAAAAVAGATGWLMVMSIVFLVCVPLFAITAYGLFQRKSWSRKLAIVSLGLVVILSIINFSGIMSILWLVVAAVVLYLFITDDTIKQALAA